MSKQDYEIWLNRPVLNELLVIMNDLDSWPAPIPHPYFYDFPCDRQTERNPEIQALIQKLLRHTKNEV